MPWSDKGIEVQKTVKRFLGAKSGIYCGTLKILAVMVGAFRKRVYWVVR
jgi:hypothetical protein